MAKKKKKSVTKQLDEIWSEIIKIIGGYKCEYCGKTSYLNSHHIFSRSNYAVRWEPINGSCLCSGHHTLSSTFSAHKTPIEFVEWIKEKRGEDWYEKLRAMARSDGKMFPHEKKELLETLEKLKNELK